MKRPNLEIYCALMMEIRHRSDAVSKLRKSDRERLPDFVRVECLVLQVRKILELVALGSMAVNESAYKKAYESFHKHSHADRIPHDLQRINPDFYPMPAKQERATAEGVDHHLVISSDADESFLRKSDFCKVYDKCGGLLHAQNPFGSARDYGYYEKNVGIWMRKIERLLSTHTMRLVNDDNLYLIHMNASDGNPHGYVLSPNTGI